MALPLEGLVVFEASAAISGGLLGRLLAQQGARVHVAGASVGFRKRFLERGKLVGWPDGTAPDVVIVDAAPQDLPAELRAGAVHDRWPRALYVAITPFGLTGPWAEVRGDELTAEALSGGISMRGTSAGTPCAAAPHTVQQCAAYAAYVAVLDRLAKAGAAGGGVLDVSLAETALLFDEAWWSYAAYAGFLPTRRLSELVTLPGMMQTRDGWIMAYVWRTDAWPRAQEIWGTGWPIADAAASASGEELARNADALRDELDPWFRTQSKWDLLAQAQARSLHWGACVTIPELVTDPHLEAVGGLETVTDGEREVVLPRLPLQPLPFAPSGAPPPRERVRVLDLSRYWAGPTATRMLSDLGMDVVKIEHPAKPDPVRLQYPKDNLPEPFPLERGWFNGFHVGKKSMGLDVRARAGREALLRMVAESDVLIENYAAGYLDHVGLGWDVLRAANPNLVYVRMTGFGQHGPYSGYIAFGINLEPLAGTPELVGDPDGPPVLAGSAVSDSFGGVIGASAVLTGLAARRAGGSGVIVDISQHQMLVACNAWAFDTWATAATVPERAPVHADGNAYRGILRCAGADAWVAISVPTEADLRRVQERIGSVDGATAGAALARWAAERKPQDVEDALRPLGIPVARVVGAYEPSTHPLFTSRQAFRPFETAAGFPIEGLGLPFLVDGRRLRGEARTHRLGEDTVAVLSEVGGLAAAEIEELLASGVASETVTSSWPPTINAIEMWRELGGVV